MANEQAWNDIIKEAKERLEEIFMPETNKITIDLDDPDLEDILSEAIADSFDMDWNSTDGAKAVIAALKKLKEEKA